MGLSLAACGTKITAFDATTYVKGLLDETYKESWDAVYLDLAGITEAEAQKAYDEGLEQEYQRFCYQFNLRDDDLAGYTTSFQDAYKNVNVGAMETKDREAFWERYENAWANGVVKLCKDKLGIANYLDVEQLLVLIAPDDKGLYGMGDNDFGNLSALILPC